MNSLFPDAPYTNLTLEQNAAKKEAMQPRSTADRINMDLSTQYLLIDLSDRRLARANNILGCIVALIAIIYFITKLLKK